MAFDYSEFVDLADEMIAEFGRSVTLVRLGRTPDNGSKPWRGTTGDTTRSAIGVFVDPSDWQAFGHIENTDGSSLERRADKIALVAAKPHSGIELEEYDELRDGVTIWRILTVHNLQPGETRLLYAFEVRR